MQNTNTTNFVLNDKGYTILTPHGPEHFLGVNKITRDIYIHLFFSNNIEIKCSLDHPFILQTGKIRKAKNLKSMDLIKSMNGSVFLIHSEIKKELIDLYDIVNSGTTNTYYTNGILSHNCEFHGSSQTLISGKHLECLSFVEPIQIELDNHYKIYEKPQRDHVYIAGVDTSEGQGKDYSAIQVIDVTEYPYKQVAVYRNNLILPEYYSEIVYRVCKSYNDAFAIIESQNDGKTVAQDLFFTYEYENLINSKIMNGANEIITSSRGDMGIRQTTKTKKLGCTSLRGLIENQLIILKDYDTIQELGTFSKKGNSYAAERGKTDDLVMGLILVTWFITQPYFQDLTDNTNIKDVLRQKYIDENENDLAIFSFYSDGQEYYNEYDTFDPSLARF